MKKSSFDVPPFSFKQKCKEKTRSLKPDTGFVLYRYYPNPIKSDLFRYFSICFAKMSKQCQTIVKMSPRCPQDAPNMAQNVFKMGQGGLKNRDKDHQRHELKLFAARDRKTCTPSKWTPHRPFEATENNLNLGLRTDKWHQKSKSKQ